MVYEVKMAAIGLRELKTHASEIIRKVKEKRSRYIVTHRGRPVAAIIPIDEVQPGSESGTPAWDELVSLGQQISQNWQSEQSSTEILSDTRRQ
jgi:prevent-host-death family protein